MNERPDREEVCSVLNELGRVPHYLYDKPPEDWDGYDISNWNGIIRRTEYECLTVVRDA